MVDKYPICKTEMNHVTHQCQCRFKEIKVMLFYKDKRWNEIQKFKFRNCYHLVGCVSYMSRAGKVLKGKVEFPKAAITYADDKLISVSS